MSASAEKFFPEPAKREKIITDEMIHAACVAGYGVKCHEDSNLYKVMKRVLTAALAAR